MKIAFFGPSHVSSYWIGEATPYRGLLKALAGLGDDITFCEPDAFGQQHLDACGPPWAKVAVYPATPEGWPCALDDAAGCNLLVKAAGAGVSDAELSWNLTAWNLTAKCWSRPTAKRSPNLSRISRRTTPARSPPPPGRAAA